MPVLFSTIAESCGPSLYASTASRYIFLAMKISPRNSGVTRFAGLGIGSDHTQHVLWRLDHGNLDGLRPKVAVVLIGVNNIPDDHNTPRNVLEGVTAVVRKLREKLPDTKVLLLGIFPFREDFCAQRAKALQVNQALHKLDDGQWVHFLDFGYVFIQPDGKISRDMMRDFLHPSSTGYRLCAEAMEPRSEEHTSEL